MHSLSVASSTPLRRPLRTPEARLRLALAVAEPRRFVVVDGVSLALHDSDPAGTKPPIVCLHAIAHGGGDFAAFERAFRDRLRVITLDWPGHGASDDDSRPASVRRYSTLLFGVLEWLGLERPILFGNSIGAGAAIHLAQTHPERCGPLVLCNPAGLDAGGVVARLFIRHLVSRFRRGVVGEARFQEWFARYYAKILRGPEAHSRRDAIVAAAYESAPRLVEAWESFSRPEADLRVGLPALQSRVFVGWAMRDGLVQWRRCRRAVASIPGATVVRFEHSGHAAFLEESQRFGAAFTSFLDGLRRCEHAHER